MALSRSNNEMVVVVVVVKSNWFLLVRQNRSEKNRMGGGGRRRGRRTALLRDFRAVRQWQYPGNAGGHLEYVEGGYHPVQLGRCVTTDI